MFYKYQHLEPSSIKYHIKQELCSTVRVTVEMHDYVMKCWRCFFLFCSLKLDVLHMIWSRCGSRSKYLTASRKQEATTSKAQHKTGMTEHWRVHLTSVCVCDCVFAFLLCIRFLTICSMKGGESALLTVLTSKNNHTLVSSSSFLKFSHVFTVSTLSGKLTTNTPATYEASFRTKCITPFNPPIWNQNFKCPLKINVIFYGNIPNADISKPTSRNSFGRENIWLGCVYLWVCVECVLSWCHSTALL